jgi:hypothetical protein
MVHGQNDDGGPASGSESDDFPRGFAEMRVPWVPTRVKQWHVGGCFRIDAREIGPLSRVAEVAGEREVIAGVATAMLASDDVFDVKLQPRDNAFPRAAVLAARRGAKTHCTAYGEINHAAALLFRK